MEDDEGTEYQEYTLVIYLSDTTIEDVHKLCDELIDKYKPDVEKTILGNFTLPFDKNIDNIDKLEPVSNLIHFKNNATCEIGPKYKKDLMKGVSSNGNIF